MENKRVIAYGFFSDMGINTRENAMQHFEEYIKQNKNWNLEKVYLYTGSKIKNNVTLQQVKQAIENNEADIVLILKIKHLGNKMQDFYDFVDKALAHNVDVISIRDNFNTLDRDCRMQYSIMKAMYEEQKQNIQRSKAGKNFKKSLER